MKVEAFASRPAVHSFWCFRHKLTFAKNMESDDVVRVQLGWLERAAFETSATPKGDFRQAWTMKLARSRRCSRLPRGFVKSRAFFVGGGRPFGFNAR